MFVENIIFMNVTKESRENLINYYPHISVSNFYFHDRNWLN